MQVSINGSSVSVTAHCEFDLPLGQIVESPLFLKWARNLDPRFTVREVEIQSVDMFGSHIGFLKIKADVVDHEGNFIPGIAFLRGGTVVMLPILECEGKEYTILTIQPRIPTGKFDSVELPAGTMDGSGSFVGKATAEIEEETGLVFSENELVDITPDEGPVFFSPGGSDEAARFFFVRKQVNPDFLTKLEGKCTGVAEEGEQIVLKVIPLEELTDHAPCDLKVWGMWAMYQKYLSENPDKERR